MAVRKSLHASIVAFMIFLPACGRAPAGLDIGNTDQLDNALTASPSTNIVGPVGMTGYVYHFGTEAPRDILPNANDIRAEEKLVASSALSGSFIYNASGTVFSLTMNGSDTSPTSQFLGSMSSGSAASETNKLESTAIDFWGWVYFKVPGDYNMTLTAADDAAAVYVGGVGLPGGGQLVAQRGYNGTWPGANGSLAVKSAGWYPLEVFWYNQALSNLSGGAQLAFSISGPAAVSVVGLIPPAESTPESDAGLTVKVFHRGTDESQSAPPGAAAVGNELLYARNSLPNYTFIDAALAQTPELSLSGSDSTSTSTFLGVNSSGSATSDTSALESTILDFTGMLTIAKTGLYSFTLRGDDAAAVFLGGSGLSGSGTLVVEANYQGSIAVPRGANPQIMLLPAGTYPFELFYYNQVYGNNAGGADLGFSVSGPAAIAFNSSQPAATGTQPVVTDLQAPTSAPAEVPILWNPTLPAFPIAYTSDEQAAQRTAGNVLVAAISAAVSRGASQYTIPSGVYRISQAIEIDNTTNFTLSANNVELIAEDNAGFFRLFTNSNLTVQGTLTLDSNPINSSQGLITAVDSSANTFTVQIMDGYSPPVQGGRIMIFDPNGRQLPHWQDRPTSITLLDAATNTYIVQMWSSEFAYYPEEMAIELQAGNYISFETTATGSGGFLMRYNTNMTFKNVNFYSASGVWSLPEYGVDHFENWYGVRRPGTNRLDAGGWLQMAFRGGALELVNSEISYHYDDLTDIISVPGWSFSQVGPQQVVASITEGGPAVGDTVNFINAVSLQPEGTATITAIATYTNAALLAQAQATAAANNTAQPASLSLVTLSSPVTISGFDIMDDQTSKMDHITMTGSYLHDGLAWGFNGKGAKNVTFTDNVAERVGFQCYSSSFDPYWNEGNVPENIIISGNVARDCSYILPNPAPAIVVFDLNANQIATGTPIQNVTITKNIVVNPHAVGISVSDANNVLVAANLIINPVATRFDNVWGGRYLFSDASAIDLTNVGPGTQVYNNVMTQVDSVVVPELIRAGSTPLTNLTISNNNVTFANGRSTSLPNGPWTMFDDQGLSGLTYEGAWDKTTWSLAYDGTLTQSQTAGSEVTITFSGSEAHVYFLTGPQQGQVNVAVDGGQAITIDTSIVDPADLTDVTLPQQASFDTGILPSASHTVRITVLSTPGSQGGGTDVALDAFDMAP